MTPRGRKPLPTSLKRLRGTYRADRAKGNEPDVPTSIPEPPDWRLVAQHREPSVLTSAQRRALEVRWLRSKIRVGYS